MKRGVIFVNTSRGPVQDEHALFGAGERPDRARRGIDVFEEEPAPLDNPLLPAQRDRVPAHRGRDARDDRQTAMQVTAEMLRVLRGERPDVLVNPDVAPARPPLDGGARRSGGARLEHRECRGATTCRSGSVTS